MNLNLEGSPSQLRAKAWSRHWATGASHSFQGSYGDAYGGVFMDFWRQWAQEIPVFSHILDIATGNGALPRLLMQACSARQFSYEAIDLAEIDPQLTAKTEGQTQGFLQFHGGCCAESLPFSADRFDAAISQFGIEYTDLSRSLEEALRVLKPSGSLAFVIHHADSRTVALARMELDDLEFLTASGGMVEVTQSMIEPMSRAGTLQGRAALMTDAQAERARLSYLQVQKSLAERLRLRGIDGADALFEAREASSALLQQALQVGFAAAQKSYGDWLLGLKDRRWRLQELVTYALSDQALRRWVTAVQERFRHSQVRPLFDRGHLLAWGVRFDVKR